MKSEKAAELELRQRRVGKAVWGVIAIALGVLFTLNNFGKIEIERKPFPARYAVDGDPATRWASQFSAPQFLSIDLGEPTSITRVKLNWEAAFARDYQVQVSDDNQTWNTIADIKDGDGGVDDLSVAGTGRYVRVNATKRGTQFGVSLWEVEVYNGDGVLSTGRKVQASSLESQGVWMMFWPVTLIGTGLPLLLAPKDGGHFIAGLMLTGLGVYFELTTLALVPASASQSVLPIALIFFGLALVLQAWHKSQDVSAAGGAQ